MPGGYELTLVLESYPLCPFLGLHSRNTASVQFGVLLDLHLLLEEEIAAMARVSLCKNV